MKIISKKFAVITLLLSLMILASCTSKKDIVYFQEINNENQVENQVNNRAQLLKSSDLIEVTVLAFDMSAVALFNGQGISGDSSGGAAKTYLVDHAGFIEFPLLGNIKMAGLTRTEATGLLKDKIAEYVKNPIVNLELKNFRVTVLGEVARPGVYQVNNERITLLEALGLAGDMTIFGERKNILVIREKDGKKSYTRIDLTSDEIFKSPVYYLSQNDVVYIEPNKTKVKQSKTSSMGVVLSVVGILLSATTLIIRNN
ncbi:MAG: polysaccharide export outer membrane protein [Urechidicola sp.]|jgi:polysaccharide export outer membrane protein|tara:strand:+ start:4161 stop:4931 length:771 start_codon:yes stop_codon:yes gene_type:complete